MLKKMNKKNNKGFSLVELIVVILIMAVLAVALAPQVMKWVGRSRIASDVQMYESLFAECQLALTDETAYTATKDLTSGSAITVTIKTGSNDSTNDVTITDNAAGNSFKSALSKIDSGYASARKKDSAGSDYTILIYKGTVHKGNAPEGTSVTAE